MTSSSPTSPRSPRWSRSSGPDIVGADGRLDRAALAAKAFATPEGKAALDAITHPAIHAEFGRRMVEAPTDAIVVMDVPLLVESKTAAERGYEVVIVVEAPEDVRLDRLEGRGLDRADAAARMKAQATDEERRAVATHLLDNGTDPEALVAQVDALWSDLRARHASKSSSRAQLEPKPRLLVNLARSDLPMTVKRRSGGRRSPGSPSLPGRRTALPADRESHVRTLIDRPADAFERSDRRSHQPPASECCGLRRAEIVHRGPSTTPPPSAPPWTATSGPQPPRSVTGGHEWESE